jgi:carbonyl reductase 1/carbonyl reductase 3
MIVIITGANRGIGEQMVKTLIQHHKKPTIILTSRNVQLGQETLQNISALYSTETHRLFYHQLDITSAQSTSEFIDWFKPKFTTFDILINNAAILDPERKVYSDPNWKMPPDIQRAVIDTNFYSTVSFTEKMLPFLSNEGKILMISSSDGQQRYHGEPIRKFLSEDTMTFDDLWNKMKEFEEKAARYEHMELGYDRNIYRVTKVFLNAYTRFVLKRKLGKCQTCFNLHPGWIKTRMGGPDATQPIEEGVVSTLRVLNMGLEESLKLNGEFINHDGSLLDYI